MKDYEKVWYDFWKEICTYENGVLNLDQIQRELSDYKFLLDNVPIVYSHICGLSKIMHNAQTIISETDEKYQEYFETMHKEDILSMIDNDMTGEEIKELIKEYFR